MGWFRDVSNTLSCRTKGFRWYFFFSVSSSIYYQCGITNIQSSEYVLYSITSWKRILRVKLLYRRAFVYSLKVVTENSQHLIEHLTKMIAFHLVQTITVKSIRECSILRNPTLILWIEAAFPLQHVPYNSRL